MLRLLILISVLCPLISGAFGATRYVSPTGGHVPPFTNWVTAATNIQAAVDAALAQDLVLVTNGVYQDRVQRYIVAAADAPTNVSYNAGWTNGSRGGFGWGPWALSPTINSGSAGFFRATLADDANLNTLPVAWGLYANNGNLATATRRLDYPLLPPDRLSLRFENNLVQVGGYVLFALQNDDTETLFIFLLQGGAGQYEVYDAQGFRNSGVSVTTTGLNLTMSLAEASGYSLSVASQVITGTLPASASGIRFLVAENSSAGPGSTHNFYLGDVRVERQTISAGVHIDREVQVRSVNGPFVTRIQGHGPQAGFPSRGVYMTSGAVLDGFTVAGGSASINAGPDPDHQRGGGVWAETHAVIQNCILKENLAGGGGGCWQGILRNCHVYSNTAFTGGGAMSSQVENCTVVYNVGIRDGGGVVGCEARNSIVLFNRSDIGSNWIGGSFQYSASAPIPPGLGNLYPDVSLVAVDNPHLLPESACRDAGSLDLAPPGPDIDGEARYCDAGVDMGCDEVCSGALTGALSVAISALYTQAVAGFAMPFTASVMGRATGSRWDFGDGSALANQPLCSHAWTQAGVYVVSLAVSNASHAATDEVTVEIVQGFTNYAALSGSHVTPFLSWGGAATTLQAAVDAAPVGGTVLVAPGVYSSGVYVTEGMASRLGIHKPLHVAASNAAPWATVIRGAGPMGASAMRGAYLARGAVLSGFTLTGGHTRTNQADALDGSILGGGAFCESGALLSNCHVSGNFAVHGGGVNGGRLDGCVIISNTALTFGGGVFGSTAYRSRIERNQAESGGGLAGGIAESCVIYSNEAAIYGGGILQAIARSSLLDANSAYVGGGSFASTLEHCTVVRNEASFLGGGSYADSAINSILYFNTALVGLNYLLDTFTNCCTTPMPVYGGSITNNPLFASMAAADFDLQAVSPCIDAGLNQAWMSSAEDIEGRPRVLNGRTDIGAHEFRFEANLMARLQGADTGGLMRAGSDIPATSPYAADATMKDGVPSNVVDWVLVQLRPSATSSPATSVSALLRDDGRLIRSDGGATVHLDAAGHQHVVLLHRNHLAVMSASAVFTSRVSSFDFSTNVTALMGGTNSSAKVSSNRWALMAGDADGDGQILPVDANIWQTQEGE
jgi:PKD repeat protein